MDSLNASPESSHESQLQKDRNCCEICVLLPNGRQMVQNWSKKAKIGIVFMWQSNRNSNRSSGRMKSKLDMPKASKRRNCLRGKSGTLAGYTNNSLRVRPTRLWNTLFIWSYHFKVSSSLLGTSTTRIRTGAHRESCITRAQLDRIFVWARYMFASRPSSQVQNCKL